MEIRTFDIVGVTVFVPRHIGDERGYFAEKDGALVSGKRVVVAAAAGALRRRAVGPGSGHESMRIVVTGQAGQVGLRALSARDIG